MEISKKKILVIDLNTIDRKAGGRAGEADICQDILDKINEHKNISRIVIVGDEEDRHVKWIMFFIFLYCQIGVSVSQEEYILDDIFRSVPHKLQNRDYILKVGGGEIEGVDYISVEDLCK